MLNLILCFFVLFSSPQKASGVTGAQIVENTSITYYVSPDGDDSNAGTSQSPFRTLQKGMAESYATLAQNIPVKLFLYNGVYRESVTNLTWEGLDALFVLEGESPDGVVLSGSDVLPANEWVEVATNLYRHDWSYDFGLSTVPWNEAGIIGQRREMMFLNGAAMRQKNLENYIWETDGESVFYEYIDCSDPVDVLTPFTFGVAERDENGNALYLCLEDGLSGLEIEAATRESALGFMFKKNLVVRNLTIQHYANRIYRDNSYKWFRSEPIKLSGADNVLIENCNITWNNADGMEAWSVSNITVKGCSFSYNGYNGMDVGYWNNAIITNCTANFNNWRGHWGNEHSVFTAGYKFHHCDGVSFYDQVMIGNLCNGLWFDLDCRNVLVQDGVFLANMKKNLFFELSPGPFEVNRCLSAFCPYSPMGATLVKDIEVRNCISFNSGKYGFNNWLCYPEQDYPKTAMEISWYNRQSSEDFNILTNVQAGVHYMHDTIFSGDESVSQLMTERIFLTNSTGRLARCNYKMSGADNLYESPGIIHAFNYIDYDGNALIPVKNTDPGSWVSHSGEKIPVGDALSVNFNRNNMVTHIDTNVFTGIIPDANWTECTVEMAGIALFENLGGTSLDIAITNSGGVTSSSASWDNWPNRGGVQALSNNNISVQLNEIPYENYYIIAFIGGWSPSSACKAAVSIGTEIKYIDFLGLGVVPASIESADMNPADGHDGGSYVVFGSPDLPLNGSSKLLEMNWIQGHPLLGGIQIVNVTPPVFNDPCHFDFRFRDGSLLKADEALFPAKNIGTGFVAELNDFFRWSQVGIEITDGNIDHYQDDERQTVLYYSFEDGSGDVTDLSEQGVVADTGLNNAIYASEGSIYQGDYSASFWDASHKIVVKHSNDLDIHGDFEISMAFRITCSSLTNLSNHAVLIKKENSFELSFEDTDNDMVVDALIFKVYQNGIARQSVFPLWDIDMFKWYTVVANYNGEVISLSLNGTERGSIACEGEIDRNSSDVVIGEMFNGRLDELRVIRTDMKKTVLFYDFEEGAGEAIDSARFGQMSDTGDNSAIYENTGSIYKGVFSAGVWNPSQKITVPCSDDLAITGPFELSAAIRITLSDAADLIDGSVLFRKSGSYELGFHDLDSDGIVDALVFCVYQSGEPHTISVPIEELETFKWYWLQAVYDGAKMGIFLDGQRMADLSLSGSVDETGSALVIGENFNGRLDNIKVKVLSQVP